MRLDKYLALCLAISRADARDMLRAGRVTLSGETVRDAGVNIDEAAAVVRVDGVPAAYQASFHLMLHKPAGILTAANDPRRETVLDLIPARYAAAKCMPIGRLDMDAEGLLLFTTDGQLAHRLLSPKRKVEKLYEAEVDAPLTPEDVEAFARGLALSDFTALPAKLEILPGAMRARVTVCEGKFHQVKRMFLARGAKVTRLKRLCFGGVWLDESLAPGAFRELTDQETALLYAVSGGHAHG